ncbi:serine/threonine protein kinase [Pseudoxanthomonas sangjuensis]|uniref:bifunctional serine/threonine-protein kinase/universal stress protein n=1 Tax=Pseudoxanthomonas sangjuensis TaxID=1503750 RepID=UPI001391842C|nr:bifunctional serine/threonine-protein kinase/universal stress protein [Pseudoxanthomonas sangjuensis]KAF1714839.1 serine/threonine protein kinase [Pseudoxanthomonas sangjuensis]
MAPKPQPGMRIGGYELLAPLHEGGMATLWRGAHPQQQFPLLMKLPHLGYGETVTQVVGFEVERMLMPALSGPHVPRFVASGGDDDQPWLVMAHVPGKTLRPLLEHAPLPAERVAKLGARAATALDDLHRQHVVHLDIKPSNLLLQADADGGEERIVLIDFGLSHHAQLPDLLSEQFDVPIGTAPYISPEQVLGIRDDPRSDLFALGVTLYHLATGERPFGFPTSRRGLRRRLYRDPQPPRALRPEIPRWFQEIVLRCLEVDPDARYPTAAQLAFDLQHPEHVPLTERAERSQRDGRLAVTRRWLRSLGREAEPAATTPATAPLVMVAIDTRQQDQGLDAALNDVVQRLMQTLPGARLACVTVMRTARIGLDSNIDDEGRNRHVKRLLAMRHWARSLQLPDHRITFHVLESSDIAEALVEFARDNGIDHLVMGARGVTGMNRLLGSVSARVVAEAGCTATVVRSHSSARR